MYLLSSMTSTILSEDANRETLNQGKQMQTQSGGEIRRIFGHFRFPILPFTRKASNPVSKKAVHFGPQKRGTISKAAIMQLRRSCLGGPKNHVCAARIELAAVRIFAQFEV